MSTSWRPLPYQAGQGHLDAQSDAVRPTVEQQTESEFGDLGIRQEKQVHDSDLGFAQADGDTIMSDADDDAFEQVGLDDDTLLELARTAMNAFDAEPTPRAQREDTPEPPSLPARPAESKSPAQERIHASNRSLNRYGRYNYAAVCQKLLEENMVHEIHKAQRSFACQEWMQCQILCLDVLSAKPSEAIAGKAHMLLGAVPVEHASLEAKMHHMEEALRSWSNVINRKGRSRYPIPQAMQELAIVSTHMAALKAEVDASQDELDMQGIHIRDFAISSR